MSSAIHRYANNPILTAADIPYECERCYNPAATKMGDKYILLVRVWQKGRIESVALATSDDGYRFTVEPEPVLTPDADDKGRFNDPRITEIEGKYYICYCSDPEEGIKIGLAETTDFRSYRRFYLSEPDNRNAVLFPERINGLYARLDRPFSRQYFLDRGYDIWVSYSPDLEFWGRHARVADHNDIAWASNKIGPGPQPIKTDKGWLVIYHGAEITDPASTAWAKVYRAGCMLLDLNDPSKVLAMPPAPLFEPETAYETDPFYRPNVVFPSGAIVEPDGEIKIYYGAADNSIAVATTTIDELLDFCLNPKPYSHAAPPPLPTDGLKSRFA
jgi:beta-1,4-mannooligosaccharide/beta-1,4-mannosyl-N-acetylglucosamine phosphorylase